MGERRWHRIGGAHATLSPASAHATRETVRYAGAGRTGRAMVACLALGLVACSSSGETPLPDAVPDTLKALDWSGEPARALGERGLENLVAMTRLLGYLRYFHPSDEAANVDWDALTIVGARRVEATGNPQELAEALAALVRPVAPTVRVFAPSTRAEPEPVPPAPPGSTQVGWLHRGPGQGIPAADGAPVAYSSRRVSPAEVGQLGPLPDPARPLRAELGGGVAAWVPLSLYRNATGTVPKGDGGHSGLRPPRHFAPSAEDRSTRLAAVALAWNVFQHFYPYFDVVSVDWHEELRRALKSAAIDAGPPEFARTLRRLVGALQDGHGVVTDGARSTGFPLQLEWVEGRIVVVAAGENVGLFRGDVIETLDGRPALEELAEEESLISAATAARRRMVALTLPEKARVGRVRLQGNRPSGEPFAVEVSTGAPVLPPRPDKIAELAPGVLYVDIDRVDDRDFESAMPRLQVASAIIFDLRGYPRRLSHVALPYLIDQPVARGSFEIAAVTQPDRVDMRYPPTGGMLEPRAPRLTARVAWLTDERAISRAETYLHMVEHHGLGTIVGRPTAGTNGNVHVFEVPGGYRIAWTAMRVRRLDGSQFHAVGVRPTVSVEPTLAGIAAGRDEILERALEVLGAR